MESRAELRSAQGKRSSSRHEVQAHYGAVSLVVAPSVPSETNIMRASGINRAFMQARSLSMGPVMAASIAPGMPSGSEGNAQPASGACAIALPASAPARIVAARSLLADDNEIPHASSINIGARSSNTYSNFILKLFHESIQCPELFCTHSVALFSCSETRCYRLPSWPHILPRCLYRRCSHHKPPCF